MPFRIAREPYLSRCLSCGRTALTITMSERGAICAHCRLTDVASGRYPDQLKARPANGTESPAAD